MRLTQMNDDRIEDIFDVNSGEVKVSSAPAVLRALALGSCVAVMVYDKINKIGGLAHIMLPGRSLGRKKEGGLKYAEDALDFLFNSARQSGANMRNLKVDIIGGANLLGEGEEGLPEKVLESILGYLRKKNVKPAHKRTGGTKRRTAVLNIESGRVFYSEGDGEIKTL